jgi:hypothetical protein
VQIKTDSGSVQISFSEALRFTVGQLGQVADFRKSQGKQLELKGTLALGVVAIAAGHLSYRAMARFGKLREQELAPVLGLSRAPSYSTLRRILMGIDPEDLRETLRRTSQKLLLGKNHQVVAVDAKTMRGCRTTEGHTVQVVAVTEQNTGVQLDAALCPTEGAELTTGRRLLDDVFNRHGRVRLGTGDALYADRHLARTTVGQGRDYLVKVKKTDPNCSTI